MYATHIKQCNKLCQSGPESTARMLRFVLATIRQPLEMVMDIVEDFENKGPESRFAFSFKADGLVWLQDYSEQIYADAMLARNDDYDLMRVFLQIPGLGLVKSGFACQMFSGRVGCIDVHNVRMYEVDPNVLRLDKRAKREETIERRVRAYIKLCHSLGGPVNLWAAWCEYKAEISEHDQWPEMGISVSLLHVDACTTINPRMQRAA